MTLNTSHLLKRIVQLNHKGNFREGFSLYYDNINQFSQLNENENRKVKNQILGSLAPSTLLYKWFTPLKCTQEMYRNAWAFSPEERKNLASQIFESIENPNLLSMHALQKVQISISQEETEKSFETYDRMCNFNSTLGIIDLLPVSVHLHQMRAAALLERDDLAEEIYHYTQRKNSNATGMHLHNTMLDAYAESRNPKAFDLFNVFVDSNMKLDSQTFINYIKACLFMDERDKLVELNELMKMHGIIYTELPELHRKEILHALTLQREISQHEEHKKHEYEVLPEKLRPITDAEDNDPFGEIRRLKPWGRVNDKFDRQNFYVRIRKIISRYNLDTNLTTEYKKKQYENAEREVTTLSNLSKFGNKKI